MLEIQTLGGLSVQENGEPIQDMGSRKAEALLAYLAVENERFPRQVLATLLWPESSEERASTSLRGTLSTLRKALGTYIEISRSSVQLSTTHDITTDVVKLEQDIAAGNVDSALLKYQGSFLEGFYIRDNQDFEDWRTFTQERIHRLIVESLHVAISSKIRLGEIKAGRDLVHYLLELDPLNETAYQRSMMLLAMDGDRSAAIVQYDRCCRLLKSELRLEPSRGTIELFNRISSGDSLSTHVIVQPKQNLPAPQSSFIGREKELAQLSQMLQDSKCRLISLVGPGGIGKTRLALEAVKSSMRSFSDGTYFVPLGTVQSPENIPSAIAQTLSLNFDNTASSLVPGHQLLDYLKQKSILFILDSFEHLIQAATYLSDILGTSANVKLIVTSRERLGLHAEWAFQVDGLPLHDPINEHCSEENNALSLFIDRAKQARSDFELLEQNLESAMRICKLVGGLPLGIELAAAWTSILACEEITDEMEKGLDFLFISRQDLPEKHRSLRAAFDHSWSLLSEAHRDTFSKLSVFRGEFDRTAAKEIVGLNFIQLSFLINKSLIRRNSNGRFAMHEALRQFAAEKLEQVPDVMEAIHDRHARYYIDMLCKPEHVMMGSEMSRIREELRREINNIQMAIHWSMRYWKVYHSLKAIQGFFNFYVVQGWHEGRVAFDHLAHEAIEILSGEKQNEYLNHPIYLSIRTHQAFFCSNLGLIDETEAFSQECLKPLRELEMPDVLSICLHNLGVSADFRGDYNLSLKYLHNAIAMGRKTQTLAWRSFYLWLGYIYFMVGEYERGMESLQDCYDLFDAIGSFWGKAFALSKMGLAAVGLKEYAQAMAYYEEAYTIFKTTGDQAGLGYTLSRMSMGAYFLESFDDAVRYGQEGYEAFQPIGHRWGICISLCRLGFANLGIGNLKLAQQKLYDALHFSKENQMIPLTLQALMGIACIQSTEGEREQAIELYQFVHQHPQIPAISLDMAAPYFPEIDVDLEPDKTAADDDERLDRIVESILKERPEN